MPLQDILDCLECNPVIAAVRDDKWEAALKSPAQVIFYLSANLMTVASRISEAHNLGKRVMIHFDLAEGIGKDKVGIHFLKQSGADGILSTRANLIRLAKEQGMVAIQRFFLLDSMAISNIEKHLSPDTSDLIEVLPALMPKVIRRVCAVTTKPVITGGLITDKEDVTNALSAGAVAVSTTNPNVWSM